MGGRESLEVQQSPQHRLGSGLVHASNVLEEGGRREGGEGGRKGGLGGQDRKDSAAGLGPEERSSSSQHLSTN